MNERLIELGHHHFLFELYVECGSPSEERLLGNIQARELWLNNEGDNIREAVIAHTWFDDLPKPLFGLVCEHCGCDNEDELLEVHSEAHGRILCCNQCKKYTEL